MRRLRDAAREALERGAPEIAASYVRRALSEPPARGERAALLLLLGTAEWRAGQPDSIAHLEQALAAAGEDPRTLIAACSVLALAYALVIGPSVRSRCSSEPSQRSATGARR